MLNLLQTPLTSLHRFEIPVAVALGVCMGLVFLIQVEIKALQALAQAQSEVALQLNAPVVLPPEGVSSKLLQQQKAISEGLEKLNFLNRRQIQQNDVTEVQEALALVRSGPWGTKDSKLKFQLNQWQQGRFVWEGIALLSSDLDHLLHALNQFPRWTQAPAVVQLQSAPSESAGMSHKSLAFVVQGDVQSVLPKGYP
jgi:hypothetical protein